MAFLQWPSRDPGENPLDYDIDWSKRLAGDTIASSSWSVDEGSVVIDSNTFSTTATKVWLSGGTLGLLNTLTNTIMTAGGREMVQSVNLAMVAK